MTEKKPTPKIKEPSLAKKREATFDLAADLCKENPGQGLDKWHKSLREKTEKNSAYLPIPISEMKAWYEHGIQVFRKVDGIPETVQTRPPIRDLVMESVAASDRATDDASRAMFAKVRKGAVDNGVAGAHIVVLQQAYLSQLTRAIVAPSHKGPGLHQVAISLCERLGERLLGKKDTMSEGEMYDWVVRINRLQSAILDAQIKIVQVESDLTGETRKDLLSVRQSGVDPSKPEDTYGGSSNDVLLQQVEGLRRQAEDIKQALSPLADMEAGIIAQVAHTQSS